MTFRDAITVKNIILIQRSAKFFANVSYTARTSAIKYSCKLRGRYIDTFPTLDELAQFLVVGDRRGFLRLLLFQRQPCVEASILQPPPPDHSGSFNEFYSRLKFAYD